LVIFKDETAAGAKPESAFIGVEWTNSPVDPNTADFIKLLRCIANS
jgi:hypothetical protein